MSNKICNGYVIEMEIPEGGKPCVHWYAGVARDPYNSQASGPLWSPYFEDAECFNDSTRIDDDGRAHFEHGENKAKFVVDNIIQTEGCKIVPVAQARVNESWAAKN